MTLVEALRGYGIITVFINIIQTRKIALSAKRILRRRCDNTDDGNSVDDDRQDEEYQLRHNYSFMIALQLIFQKVQLHLQGFRSSHSI
jgi:hypothetical protein